jgi:predicted metal-dependent enzyme (double-stranded beta helix superfamily)
MRLRFSPHQKDQVGLEPAKNHPFYELIPPTGDIHQVITISIELSISLHLMGNDVGCVLRHRFDPDSGEVMPFRLRYSNKDCEELI